MQSADLVLCHVAVSPVIYVMGSHARVMVFMGCNKSYSYFTKTEPQDFEKVSLRVPPVFLTQFFKKCYLYIRV